MGTFNTLTQLAVDFITYFSSIYHWCQSLITDKGLEIYDAYDNTIKIYMLSTTSTVCVLVFLFI